MQKHWDRKTGFSNLTNSPPAFLHVSGVSETHRRRRTEFPSPASGHRDLQNEIFYKKPRATGHSNSATVPTATARTAASLQVQPQLPRLSRLTSKKYGRRFFEPSPRFSRAAPKNQRQPWTLKVRPAFYERRSRPDARAAAESAGKRARAAAARDRPTARVPRGDPRTRAPTPQPQPWGKIDEVSSAPEPRAEARGDREDDGPAEVAAGRRRALRPLPRLLPLPASISIFGGRRRLPDLRVAQDVG